MADRRQDKTRGTGGSLVARLLLGRAGALNALEEAGTSGLLDSRGFRREVEREMLRSDRTASPLTLLVFDLTEAGEAGVSEEALERLAGAVAACSRKTDVAGWYRDGAAKRPKVGLILHHTEAAGAPAVVEKVRGALEKRGGMRSELTCEIYGYPGVVQSNKSHGDPEQLWLFDDDTLAGLEPRSRNGSSNGYHPPASARYHREGPDDLRKAHYSIAKFIASPLPIWKRALDLFGSTVGLVLLSPAFLVIALIIKLTSRGPVFFKQTRVGYFGDPFLCWKFRSMRDRADNSTHKQYLRSIIGTAANDIQGREAPMTKLDAVDPEITWIGNILRKTCIDELPQLINVFLGEMSLVGPRPCLPYEAEQYLRWHTRRFDSMPGMSGLWQVMGKNNTTFKQMIRLDIKYAANCSFMLDVKILILTIPAVINEVREGMQRKKQRLLLAKQVAHTKHLEVDSVQEA